MGLSCWQLRLHVVRPTLHYLNLWSSAAEALVLGTAAHESGGFVYLDQVTAQTKKDDDPAGPAYGLWQIEAATHRDLWANFLRFHADLQMKAGSLRASWPDGEAQLVSNLAYACAVARLIYYRAKPPLPAGDDIDGLAAYWDRFYNRNPNKGTPAEWAASYREHVR